MVAQKCPLSEIGAPRARGLFVKISPFQCFVRGHCKQIGAIGFSPGWSPKKLFREQGFFLKDCIFHLSKGVNLCPSISFLLLFGGYFFQRRRKNDEKKQCSSPLTRACCPPHLIFQFYVLTHFNTPACMCLAQNEHI